MKWSVLLSLVVMPLGASAQGNPAAIRRLIDSGHLLDAQRAARVGGDADAEALGDILVMRGQLAAGDVVYRMVIARDLPNARAAAAGRAELAMGRGERDSAVRIAGGVVAAFTQSGSDWSAPDCVAAGRAYAVLGRWDPHAFHDALRAFDRATARDSTDIEAQLRAGDLLLDKYNDPDARDSYRTVLQRVPGEPRALLGLARADAFEGNASATDAARRALAGDPNLVPALLLLAEQHLQAEAYDSAITAANRALAIDSSSVQAWGILGAIAWMRGDSAGYRTALAQAEHTQPAPVDFLAEIAEAAGRQRRYADAVVMASAAVAADSTSARALGVLADNQLRTSDLAAGRANLERAFAADPYNLWRKNTLDLLDNLRTFKTITTARFQFVAPADEADYLALYLGPLLERAYDTLAIRYGYQPPTPIRVELYGRHADFSVRTVGLTGLGALGVSFGTLLVLDSPRAEPPGELNYGSTAWHELTHSFTLGLSAHRVPRWLSEGLSVLEERRAGRGWGDQATVDFLATYKGGVLPTATHLNEGLVRPAFGEEVGLSYYEASMVCAMIEEEHGIGAIRDILKGYADGSDTRAVFERVLGLSLDSLDQHFDRWVRARFAAPLAVIDASDGRHPVTGAYVDWIREGAALLRGSAPDSGRGLLRRAEAAFPDDGAVDGPAWLLAHDARDHGDLGEAAAQLSRVTMHNETAVDANGVESSVRLQIADSTGSLAALRRQQWIGPYDVGLHERTAELSEALHDFARAVVERRAIVALDPPDPLEARYQLARTLWKAGDVAAARREVLRTLEQAPEFAKAQALLLDINGNHW